MKGLKTESEKFAGAIDTYCIEALMQDGKSLQAGTSHFLGQNFAKAFDVQNFAKAFDVKFTNEKGKLDLVWATSWGVSTRLVGALIMAHSDDKGLVLPPKLAPFQVVIIPIYNSKEQLAEVSGLANTIKKTLENTGISVKYDDRDTHKPGWKFNEYEFKGIPVRIAIGPRDIENKTLEVARRDTLEKSTYKQTGIEQRVKKILEEIQDNLFQKATLFREKNTREVDNYEEFKQVLEEKGGFILAHWDGTEKTELKIKKETKATIRCIPFTGNMKKGKCIYSGKPSEQRVVFAKAY